MTAERSNLPGSPAIRLPRGPSSPPAGSNTPAKRGNPRIQHDASQHRWINARNVDRGHNRAHNHHGFSSLTSRKQCARGADQPSFASNARSSPTCALDKANASSPELRDSFEINPGGQKYPLVPAAVAPAAAGLDHTLRVSPSWSIKARTRGAARVPSPVDGEVTRGDESPALLSCTCVAGTGRASNGRGARVKLQLNPALFYHLHNLPRSVAYSQK